MLTTVLVDPSAFDRKHFENITDYKLIAEQFLDEMTSENGVWISDKGGELLLYGIYKKISALPDRYGQYLSILLTEALKDRRWRFVEFADCFGKNFLEISSQFQSLCPPDAIIVSPESTSLSGSERSEVMPLHQYGHSTFRERRRGLMLNHQDLRQLTRNESQEVFVRTIQFSNYLCIYDKQIGRANNLSGFLGGIKYILRLWKKYSKFAGTARGNRRVEIYTCSNENDEKNIENIKCVKRNLINPLKKSFPELGISLLVRQDRRHSMHARYLEAAHAILQLDRGFDLFDNNKKFKSNPVSFKRRDDQNIKNALKEFRELPKAPRH